MADEKATADENVQDEIETLDDADVQDDEAIEDEENQDTEDDLGNDDDGEQEAYDSEAEFLAKHGIEGYDSLDDALKDFQKLKSAPKKEDKEPERDRKPSQGTPGAEQKEFLGRNVFTKHINKLIESGAIEEQHKAGWLSMAKAFDEVNDPILQTQEQAFGILAHNVDALTRDAREGSWIRFIRKGMVPDNKADSIRKKLDKMLDQNRGLNYEEAYREMVIKDPDAFREMVKTLQKQGGGKTKKSMPKFSSGRKTTAPGGPSASGFRKYLTPDGQPDEAKLAELPTNRKLKIINDIMEYEKARAKRG